MRVASAASVSTSQIVPGICLTCSAASVSAGIADHVAERHEDDARHQEDQHQPERDQHIDRAGGDAVLRQEKGDLRRHA